MRSMQKAIDEFKALIKTGREDFSVSDINQIYEKGNDTWDYITDALRAGYAIGYRTAKREMRNQPCQ